MFGLGLFVLWGVYRFSFAPASPESLTPIPLGQYWQAISFQLGHQGSGHTSYLLGMTSGDGWWYYYPIAFLVKTSLPLLLLLGLALSRGRFDRDELFLALPAGLFFLVSMTQNLNLGIRYLLPIYPLLIILVGRILAREWPGRGRMWVKGLVVTLAVWAAAEGHATRRTTWPTSANSRAGPAAAAGCWRTPISSGTGLPPIVRPGSGPIRRRRRCASPISGRPTSPATACRRSGFPTSAPRTRRNPGSGTRARPGRARLDRHQRELPQEAPPHLPLAADLTSRSGARLLDSHLPHPHHDRD